MHSTKKARDSIGPASKQAHDLPYVSCRHLAEASPGVLQARGIGPLSSSTWCWCWRCLAAMGSIAPKHRRDLAIGRRSFDSARLRDWVSAAHVR